MLHENLDHIALLLGIDPTTLPSGPFQPRNFPENAVPDGMTEIQDLSDEEFGLLQPHLAPEPRNSEAISNGEVLNALLWCRATRRALTHLPARYGSAEAIRKRAERWAIAGVWDRLGDALAGLDLSERRRAELRRLCDAYGRRGERIRRDRRAAEEK